MRPSPFPAALLAVPSAPPAFAQADALGDDQQFFGFALPDGSFSLLPEEDAGG